MLVSNYLRSHMRYIYQHIDFVILSYKGEMPLSNFLKFYFKKHPILGSRDRKIISEMAYCFYRVAKGITPDSLSTKEKVELSFLICNGSLTAAQKILPEELQVLIGNTLEDKISALMQKEISFHLETLCQQSPIFSNGIQKTDWLQSMLQRPLVFLSIKPQFYNQAIVLLHNASIWFKELDNSCIAIENSISIEQHLPPNMYRIQDYSSQKTGEYFTIKENESCWDCCSGAGGKALLIKDKAPNASLCVSDIRKSILVNLVKRFKLYGHAMPEQLVVSVSDTNETKTRLQGRSFDHIIADVPCSGSGTWARTPEQLYFFDPNTLQSYSERQQQIVNNVVKYLKPRGKFVYITCSVFEAENERVLHNLLSKNPTLRLIHQELINGIDQRADSMFVALIEKAR